ncbi:ATP-binding protein [Kineococcus radiotolerans]|uniref:Regulatory protein LuxR n=1 Tax=Kineococcus radiotolerans (strain ATCC BAA-149 / DSM 14245 / SRS30216) TaxID=266940 RepID=A6WAF3_KINRD|nr:LuxR family transcriptional regulator [Kineococcus radiotolerans]ABS03792.1 regulatory protein LuxR [Kineococcus radiotolerans SRS30216 = ATCC BAA-149]
MIGREVEVERILGHLYTVRDASSSAEPGTAVLITGEAGIGKTTLLHHITSLAQAADFSVLRCTGVQQELGTGFSALHELLRPTLGRLHLLPHQQRAALMTVFGLDDGTSPPPDRLLINTATLTLLEEISAQQPLLVLVEDLQWLDRSSASVLTFLIRRLAHTRTLLLATMRTGEGSQERWAGLGMVHLPLAALSPQACEALMDELTPPIDARTREVLLREAGGNPLALTELAAVIQDTDLQSGATLPLRLPLPQRLEKAFLQQLAPLPEATRRTLLLAAAGEDARRSEVIAAGAELGLVPLDLDLAETAGLINVEGEHLRFRHPLLRSAIYSSAPYSVRLQAHLVLAGAIQDPVRAAWHKAAATPAPDEEVAAELTTAADIARARGALIEASAAYERAAALSPSPRQRLQRLVQAAELARLAGRPSQASRLGEEAMPLLIDPTRQPSVAVMAAVTRWRLSAGRGSWMERVTDLVDLAEQLRGAQRDQHPLERLSALTAAAVGVYVLQPAGALAERVRDGLRSLQLPAPGDPTAWADQQVGLIMLDPLRYASRWRGRLAELTSTVSGPNRLASAAEAIHDLPSMASAWSEAVERAHYSRAVSEECLALHGRALSRVLGGDLPGALADAGLAQRIAADAQLPIIRAAGQVVASRIHTCRGDLQAAARALGEAAQVIGPSPVGKLNAELNWAAGLLALTEHRHWDAWVHLNQTHSHPVIAAWAIADLAQAAVQVGKAADVIPRVQVLAEANLTYGSPHLSLLLERSRALLSQGERAEAAFQRALTHGSASGTPIELARTQLAYGQWLRLADRPEESQTHLSAALRAFEGTSSRLGIARTEAALRTAGVVMARGRGGALDPVDTLSPLELQVAQLATTGLSEEEIADRIYLSHRAVSSHLHRALAKLNLTTRAELRQAFAPRARPM